MRYTVRVFSVKGGPSMPEAVHIPWQPIGGGRASEAIYDQLRELITSGVLKPGNTGTAMAPTCAMANWVMPQLGILALRMATLSPFLIPDATR